MRKLLRFPWTDSGKLGVYLGLLNKIFAYKTIESFDETTAEEVAVVGYGRRLDNIWCWAEFRSLAKHSSKSIGVQQLILAVFLVKDIVNRVVCAAKLQLLQRHSQDSSLDQCFNWECQPVLSCYSRGIQYSSSGS